MARSKKLEKKRFYTEEELLTGKIPYCDDYSELFVNDKYYDENNDYDYDEVLMQNLYNIMFTRAGYSYEWAKEHDLKDLHVIDLVIFKSEKEHDECSDVLKNILRKQMGFSKKEAEREIAIFNFGCGLSFVFNPEIDKEKKHSFYLDEDKFKENLRYRIKLYEDKNGDLKYSDGFEKELKKYCKYGEL